jgi:DNA-binding GntR family transcriptional regulator
MTSTIRAVDAPLRPGTDVGRVHADLRSMILDGTLEPGRRISQAELSRLTDAGRTPLREALRMLQQEGLVKAELNKGITIAALDLDDLDCIYAYRVSMESTAIRITVPLLTDPELQELDGTMTQMGAAIERGDRDGFDVPHRRFHQLLLSRVQEGARARMAVDADRAERVRRLLIQGDEHAFARAHSEHREIQAAAHARDGVVASRLLASHLSRSAFYVAAQLEPTYDTVLTRTALRTVLGEELPRVSQKTAGRDQPNAPKRQTRASA